MTTPDFTETPLDKLVSLEGRTAVVTGGARGIGLAIAKRLMEAGANIVIADKDENGCMKSALSELNTNGHEAIGFKYDTRSREEMEQAADHAEKHFGSLDIWVNDAGIYPSTPVMKISEKEWDAVIDTNVSGVFHGARAAIPHMKKKGGVILNISSVTGLNGSEEYAHYSSSKFAVRGMTATLAKELGEHNIRVVAIAPTLIETPGVHEHKKEMDKKAGEDTFKHHAEEIPLGRIGQPDDVARAALFLASDMAAFVTGTTLVVDGGNLALG
jgi:NAD(P)-dependent dehydrogenase (short-subunit alcohol dehydrogenase family)